MQVEVLIALGIVLSRRRLGRAATFIDTSTLMDGRIQSVVASGFVPHTLIIPRSVLLELQLLADGSDSDKRMRARHGLDVAEVLRASTDVRVRILNDARAAKHGVDNQLLLLARKHHGSICTIDYNLNKVARAEGIPVLNVNELAQSIRVNHLPGERVSLLIQQKGDNADQGVGYMADGTMVVVDQAKSLIGSTVEIEIIRSLQTAAGRMLFAKLVKTAKAHTTKPSKQQNSSHSKRQSISAKRNGGRSKKNTEDSVIALANGND